MDRDFELICLYYTTLNSHGNTAIRVRQHVKQRVTEFYHGNVGIYGEPNRWKWYRYVFQKRKLHKVIQYMDEIQEQKQNRECSLLRFVFTGEKEHVKTKVFN